eukprot:9308737-Pyramimonas_sp.AAC.1
MARPPFLPCPIAIARSAGWSPPSLSPTARSRAGPTPAKLSTTERSYCRRPHPKGRRSCGTVEGEKKGVRRGFIGQV